MVASVALLCLSLNVYMEARGEPTAGQLRVAQVTMNRAKQKPAAVCPVVTKPYAFSWTAGCLRRVKQGSQLLAECIPKEELAWNKAVYVAQRSLMGRTRHLTCADHFLSGNIAPRWVQRMRLDRRVAGHRFYISPKQAKICA